LNKKLLPLILVFLMIFNLFSFTASTVKANSVDGNVVLILDDPNNEQIVYTTYPFFTIAYRQYMSNGDYYYKFYNARVDVENTPEGKKIVISNLDWNLYDKIYIAFTTNKYLFYRTIDKNEIDNEIHIAPDDTYVQPNVNIEFADDSLMVDYYNYSTYDENRKPLYLAHSKANVMIPQGIYNLEVVGKDNQYGYFLEKSNISISNDNKDFIFSRDEYALVNVNLNNTLNKELWLETVAQLSNKFYITPMLRLKNGSTTYNNIYLNKQFEGRAVFRVFSNDYYLDYNLYNINFNNVDNVNLGTQLKTQISLTKSIYSPNDFLRGEQLKLVDEYGNKVTIKDFEAPVYGKLDFKDVNGNITTVNNIDLFWPNVSLSQFKGTYEIKFYLDYNKVPIDFDTKIINISDEGAKVDDVNVTVDKTIIKVGEETEVTITAKNGDKPLANEYIRLEGAGINVEGYTNGEGKFVARIKPQWSEKIRINIANKWFYNKLLAKRDDQAILEAVLKDRDGNYVNDIYLSLFGEHHGSGEAGDGDIVRSILNPGQYKAILSSYKGYYLVKNIELNPGEYKRIEFDANEGVEVTLKANYMHQAFANAEVKIKTNDKYNDWGDHLGRTDLNGERKIIITPGTYDVIFERWDGERVKLTDETTVDGNINLLTFNWDETNTGKINITSDIYAAGYNIESINLNDTEYYFFNNNSWITNAGNYNITRIMVRNNTLNEWYIFEPIEEKQLTLNPGESNNINIELNEKSCELRLDKETINAGQAVIGSVDILTNDGYLLNHVNSNGNEYYLVDVSLEKPNGEIIDYGKRYFKDIYIWIPPYFESGTYKLIVKGYFGSLYGEKQFIKEINIEGGFNTVPGIPYNVVPVVDNDKVVITWDHEFGAEGYRIYRSESVDGKYELIGEIVDDPNIAPTFIDENVEPGKTYYYKITSINRFGEGDPCDPVSITIPTQQNNEIKYGDVNNDGVVNSMDYSLIKRFILNKVILTQEQIKVADVDGDGSVTSLDYSLVKRYILGKIAKFPVEE